MTKKDTENEIAGLRAYAEAMRVEANEHSARAQRAVDAANEALAQAKELEASLNPKEPSGK